MAKAIGSVLVKVEILVCNNCKSVSNCFKSPVKLGSFLAFSI